MAEFVNTIDLLGDEVVFNSLVDRSITEFKDDTITTLGNGAFGYCKNLTTCVVPNVSTVNNEAFQESGIKSIELANITKCGTRIFMNCSSLEYVSLPKLTSTTQEQFRGCTSLKSVNLPAVKGMGSFAFQDCKSLESISLPSLTSTGGHSIFGGCQSLKTLDIPRDVKFTGDGVFGSCHSLVSFETYSMTAIPGSLFSRSANIRTFVLRNTAGIVTLSNLNAFDNTPFTVGVGGIVYVPESLITSYQTATNWSTLYTLDTCEFRPLETVTVDGTTTGELKKCASISLDKTALSFTGAGSQTLNATFTPALPYVDEVVWTSSDRSVAIVDDGVVTAVGNGSTSITVTCGDKSASCNVTVTGVSSPVPWWSLPEAVTFTSVNDCVDTELPLFEKPIDFTIICAANFTTKGIITYCVGQYSYTSQPGFCITGAGSSITIAYPDPKQSTYGTTSLIINNTSTMTALALRYTAGILDGIFYKNNSGEIIPVSLTNECIFIPVANTLILGASQNQSGVKTHNYSGTINTFDIYSSALDDATIASKLQAL